MQSMAWVLTIGCMLPCESCHENKGSWGPAGTTLAKLQRAAKGQTSSWRVENICCISHGFSVLADGRSRWAYSFPSRSNPKQMSQHLRCFEPSKANLDFTIVSPIQKNTCTYGPNACIKGIVEVKCGFESMKHVNSDGWPNRMYTLTLNVD